MRSIFSFNGIVFDKNLKEKKKRNNLQHVHRLVSQVTDSIIFMVKLSPLNPLAKETSLSFGYKYDHITDSVMHRKAQRLILINPIWNSYKPIYFKWISFNWDALHNHEDQDKTSSTTTLKTSDNAIPRQTTVYHSKHRNEIEQT